MCPSVVSQHLTYIPVGNLRIKVTCVFMISVLAGHVAIMNNCRTFRPHRSKQSNFFRNVVTCCVQNILISNYSQYLWAMMICYYNLYLFSSTYKPFCFIRVFIPNFFQDELIGTSVD